MFKHPDYVTIEGEKSLKNQAVHLYLSKQVNGEPSFAKPIEWYSPEESKELIGSTSQPSLKFRYDEAQDLMDELWRMGFRPINGEGNAGQLAATQAHLKDMQLIALGFIKQHIELLK